MKNTITRKAYILAAAALLVTCSCSKDRAIGKALEAYYSDKGLRAMQVDFILVSPDSPDVAYASATITHNYAGRNGDFQKEFIGHIFKREDNEWKLERKTNYTTEKAQALDLLSNRKIQSLSQ